MRTRLLLCLLSVMFCLAVTARADDDKPDPARAKKGMTMAQVKKTYGDPASEATDKEHGTLWTYVPNRGLGAIPFYGAYVKYHIVQIFFRTGRVYKVNVP